MSLAGLRATRGSTVTVRRASESQKDEGDEALTWAGVAAAVQLRIEVPRAWQQTVFEREYGIETGKVRVAYAALAQDLREKDGLIVTAGLFAGEHLRIEGVTPRPAHLEVVLALTSETFA